MADRFGHILCITSFGESHGPSVGVVIEGLPPAFPIDLEHIHRELQRRRPGQSKLTTQRNEGDDFKIVSGVFEGYSTGAPICILIPNNNQNSSDYDHLKNVYRPGHADRVYDQKYGIRDHNGGGRSSARITAGWVAAGSIAKQFIQHVAQIKIQSVVSKIHHLEVNDIYHLDWQKAEDNIVRCPDPEMAEMMIQYIDSIKNEGDSVGGIISTKIENCPLGLGEPVFDKLNAEIGKAILSINAVKGIEFGAGFAATDMKGSEHNDTPVGGSNNEGGITGGISNGKTITFNTAFKPVSSISKSQKSIDKDGNEIELKIEGRHDPCVLPRAVPIVEAMTALVIADHWLMNLKNQIMTQI
ncbi:MAG TPA: chorismate synthase [Bacteroidia bacterium]